VNRLPKTVTRQCRGCDLNPGHLRLSQHANHSATEPPFIVTALREFLVSAGADDVVDDDEETVYRGSGDEKHASSSSYHGAGDDHACDSADSGHDQHSESTDRPRHHSAHQARPTPNNQARHLHVFHASVPVAQGGGDDLAADR